MSMEKTSYCQIGYREHEYGPSSQALDPCLDNSNYLLDTLEKPCTQAIGPRWIKGN